MNSIELRLYEYAIRLNNSSKLVLNSSEKARMKTISNELLTMISYCNKEDLQRMAENIPSYNLTSKKIERFVENMSIDVWYKPDDVPEEIFDVFYTRHVDRGYPIPGHGVKLHYNDTLNMFKKIKARSESKMKVV